MPIFMNRQYAIREPGHKPSLPAGEVLDLRVGEACKLGLVWKNYHLELKLTELSDCTLISALLQESFLSNVHDKSDSLSKSRLLISKQKQATFSISILDSEQ